MPVSRKNESAERRVPEKNSGTVLGLKDSSQLPNKRTINLCMKEKDKLSKEMFLIVLSLILIVVMLVEFFGIYRPYVEVENLENRLSSAQSELDAKNAAMSDYKDVEEFFDMYNYDDYDNTLADRLDVMQLFERNIMNVDKFASAKIDSLSISGRRVTFTIKGLTGDLISELYQSLCNDKIVEYVDFPRTSTDADNIQSTDFEVTLLDATLVPADKEADHE